VWGAALLAALGGCGDEAALNALDEVDEVEEAVTTLAPKLDPDDIPKFATQFEYFRTFRPRYVFSGRRVVRADYDITIKKFNAQQLPAGFPATPLFGYSGRVWPNLHFTNPLMVADAILEPDGAPTSDDDGGSSAFISSPGPKFEQTRGVPARITYRNELLGAHPLPVDPTLDWANPNNFPKPQPPFLPFPPGYPQAQSPITHVTHTHGIEVLPHFDGTPDLWFTPNGITGPEFVSNTYLQPSSNQSAPFWYHDHSFGVTRLDVGMGLSGFSILRDRDEDLDEIDETPLPQGEFEVAMIIQDRSFRTDGTVFYPTVGRNPDVNPYWELTVAGDTNVVNGKVWPNFNVKRAAYRFRILNSANQRFYDLSFSNGMPFTIIGGDGGYQEQPRVVRNVLIGVTERVDILVDFSQFAPGTQIVMRNTAGRFPPLDNTVDPNNDGIVMRFTVGNAAGPGPRPLPAVLNDIPTLTPNRPTRTLIQNVQQDDAGRILQAELDGQLFHTLTTELPTVGATEDWEFVNLTPLDHNKHVHLIQFLVVKRQTFDRDRYLRDWLAINGNPPFTHPTLKLPVGPYLTGSPVGPDPHEEGWKDTVRTPAEMVTTIRIRWAQQEGTVSPGQNNFPFDPINGVGFVWHCHLLEHEDNEMMRPLTVVPIWRSGASYQTANRLNPGVQRGVVDFNGINYGARVNIASSTQPPPQRPDLWERINNMNGDWAVQIIYNVSDRVKFGGRVYRALQRHQATNANAPPNAAFWQLVL
jgi:FtsP/CotA-like multicopper oxidase with cupredoxin domain